MCCANSDNQVTVKEQQTFGFKKLYAVIPELSYSALEEMRKEVIFLTAAIENRQDKLRQEALKSKPNLEIL